MLFIKPVYSGLCCVQSNIIVAYHLLAVVDWQSDLFFVAGDILHATLRNTATAAQRTGSTDDSGDDEAALTRPVTAGEETEIIIDKGQTGLGLSIVGGSDTLLVGFLCFQDILAVNLIQSACKLVIRGLQNSFAGNECY